MPPGEWKPHDVSIGLHLRPHSPAPPTPPPEPPALPGEQYRPVVEAFIRLLNDVAGMNAEDVQHALAHYLTIPDDRVLLSIPSNGTTFSAIIDTSANGMPESHALKMMQHPWAVHRALAK